MSLPVKTGLPDNLVISDGYIVRFAAVDPVTGNAVTGVKISSAAIQATPTSGSTNEPVLNPVLVTAKGSSG